MAEPDRRAGPTGHIGDQLHDPFHRHVLVDQQVHHQRLDVEPVAGPRRGHLLGQRGDVLAPAAAADPVQVVLDHLDLDLGQVMHLMRAFDAHVGGPAQPRPARAVPARAMRHVLVRGVHPTQRGTRRALLLAALRPEPRAVCGIGFFRPGRSSLDGGIDEFLLLRPWARSNAVTRSSSSAFALVSSLIAAVCSTINTSRDAHDPHPGAGRCSITAA